MVIHIWTDGSWVYDFELEETREEFFLEDDFISVSLDYLYAYKNLTPLQIKACEEALSE